MSFPMSLIVAAVGGTTTGYGSTYLGQLSTEGDGYVVKAWGDDLTEGSSSSTARTELCIKTTASETYVICNANGTGNGGGVDEAWYIPTDSDQGAPGTDEVIFTLGERIDSCNIYTAAVDEDAANVRTPLGTFTDDDKSTFFNPSDATLYGTRIVCTAMDSGGGPDTQFGGMTMQFTFRKTGFTDLTLTFKGYNTADAEDIS